MRELVAAVDLGGTKIYTALADQSGRVLAEVMVPTRPWEGAGAVIGRIVDTVDQVLKQAGEQGPPLVLGIGAPGPLNAATGVVYQAPNLGWYDVPLKELLEERLGIPVAVDNDANLGALGEYVYGAGRGEEEMVYITVSTGIGGGLVLQGRLYHGAGYGSGEIGHMTIDPDGPRCGCGNYGCLEAMASGTAMAREARRLVESGGGRAILEAAGGDVDAITARAVARAASTGDGEARQIIESAGRALGIGVANVINLLNPALVVLGGGAMQVGPLLWETMEGEVYRRAWAPARRQVRLVPAELGGRSGLMGAVALALQKARGEKPPNAVV
ncbi:ROK family protein [Desulfofundulus salinus]|uniref:ROK family protein n=1 Tax=Desulfofundulus salinus TaxID=2419843 RepID=A0A494WST0_9FIRM|nr:ROK family protein [Desulfofundulus salinum]RKO65813.1 ROK family protein [Desulfofundulus salinum]